MLVAAGWAVQDARRVNLAASRGVAVREFVMKPPHGRADYLLFLDGRAAGVVEAKKEGETLVGVERQSAKYVDGLPDELEPAVEGGLAFVYESTGDETRFTNRLDPDPASRPVFSFHRPETLDRLARRDPPHPTAPTLRHRLRALPRAAGRPGCGRRRSGRSRNLEASLAANRPRALIQMATGSGKTFTAANVSLPAGQARRRRADPVPRRPGEPRPPDAEGVPGVRHARRRPQVHRALQRPAPRLEQDRPRRARRDLDDPAPLLDPARRGGARPRSSTSTRPYELDRPSRCRSSTTRRSRPRRSTW